MVLTRDPFSPTSPANRLATKRNGGLLLTCKELHQYSKSLYYKHTTFQSNTRIELHRFIRTLKQEGNESRKLITKINWSLTSDIVGNYLGYDLVRFSELYSGVEGHSKQMCLLIAAQKLLDIFGREMWKNGWGVKISALRGSAEAQGAKVDGLIADVEDEEQESSLAVLPSVRSGSSKRKRGGDS